MLNFFDRLFSSINNKSVLLTKLRFYSVLRFVIKLSANITIPIYFELLKKKHYFSLNPGNKTNDRVIVSITSFPSRINRIWLVIESLLHQKHKPDKIILWLSVEQFPSLNKLPKRLLELQKRGLEIRICENDLRSHKKYYYAFIEYPNDYIITVDDDVFYSSYLLTNLLAAKNKYPNSICCNEASFVRISHGIIEPYCNWENVIGEYKSNYEIIPIGVGGVLYPPNSLYKDVLRVELFKEMCFSADDIWLNVMARLKGTMIVKTQYNSNYLPVMNANNKTLYSINLLQGHNDIQLNKVRKYYIDNQGIDPYLID